jgi:uncharacterized protein (DUF1810 family)
MADLQRFLDAQDYTLEVAISELTKGQKESHWMWFVFPQLAALGRSDTARFFGIADLAEAQDYLKNETLNRRLKDCARAVVLHRGKSIKFVMGEVDALKLRSSATLFSRADATGETGRLMRDVLGVFYKGQECKLTLLALGSP